MSQYRDKFLSLWSQLRISQSFWIVDDIINEEFWIVDIDDITLEIRPQQNIKITKHAFVAVIDYLVEHNHFIDNACEVRTGDTYERSVPLSRVVQEANPYMTECCLNYVLAILKALGIVDITATRLNRVWLVELPDDDVESNE
ncbi:hypothetical protein [Entomomonas asaccharolytica]|uniref:Uncharacterized protein n=1 Tax=Entomomonas asaccharolytica TaxID=2785331 RepID=A0A974NHI7_9GAMM|nr:hypothetical protein [Entomomonas asaccharolytica]QQP86652.1 hypothetical protein JHT90_05275 [Entomomonas asaccharolytica]